MKFATHTTVLICIVVAMTPSPATAQIVVNDPINLVVNVEQVLHHLEVIARLKQQIRNQQRMLENWNFTRLEELRESLSKTRDAVKEVAELDLANMYSIEASDYADRDAASVTLQYREWLESQRASVELARIAQDTIAGKMRSTQDRVAEYVEKSNSASGQTAAIQASNETIATLAAQLQDMQALELTEMRVELEEEARRQAEATFHRQRCKTLMRDWESQDTRASSTRSPISSPFANRPQATPEGRRS